MCQGFSHFSGILHHFVLAKLATTSIRVKAELVRVSGELVEQGEDKGEGTWCCSGTAVWLPFTR